MGTYRRNMWFLVPWAKEWESDIPDLRELCEQIRRLYNSRRQLDVISTVCDELLAKENLPKARTAELYCYLAGIASDSEETFEAFKLNFIRAQFALADVEDYLKACEAVDLVVAAVRTTLDETRVELESLEPKLENHGESDLAAEGRVETPIQPLKNPMLASGQQEKIVSTTAYQETVDLHEKLAELEQYKQRLAASHEERKRKVDERRKRMDRIAEAEAAGDESLSSEDSEYESLSSDVDEDKDEMEAKDQDKTAAK